jgi:hypothetical protein
MKMPVQCADEVSSCAELERFLRRMWRAEEEPDREATCSGTTVCTCTLQVSGDITHMRSSGSYVIADRTVILDQDNRLQYCAGQNTLELQTKYGEGALGTDKDISGTLFLVRKK